MTDEEIAVALNGHEHEIGSLKHRMKDQEEQSKVIQELVLSVKELAFNMRNMAEEQEKQGRGLQALENEPAERWNSAEKDCFTTIGQRNCWRIGNGPDSNAGPIHIKGGTHEERED